MPPIPAGRRNHSLRKQAVAEARARRKTMTLPEVLLWNELKADKLGISFRKPHPIGRHKADFCCTSLKLVIEVDGFAHDTFDVAKRDQRRNAIMRRDGWTVLRIPAAEVLRDIDAVLDAIRVTAKPHRQAQR